MKKLLRRSLFPVVFSVAILPATSVFAAEDSRTLPTTGYFKVVGQATLFDDIWGRGVSCGCSLAPQIVRANMKTQNGTVMYEIDTWIGKKWIYADWGYEIDPNFKSKRIDIKQFTYLYHQPTDYWKTPRALAPQSVEALEYGTSDMNGGGYYRVNTWIGDMWIRLEDVAK